jgi:WD40 repeat protein
VTGSEDNAIRLWDLQTSERIEKPLRHNGSVLAVAFDPTGELIATGSEDIFGAALRTAYPRARSL